MGAAGRTQIFYEIQKELLSLWKTSVRSLALFKISGKSQGYLCLL